MKSVTKLMTIIGKYGQPEKPNARRIARKVIKAIKVAI